MWLLGERSGSLAGYLFWFQGAFHYRCRTFTPPLYPASPTSSRVIYAEFLGIFFFCCVVASFSNYFQTTRRNLSVSTFLPQSDRWTSQIPFFLDDRTFILSSTVRQPALNLFLMRRMKEAPMNMSVLDFFFSRPVQPSPDPGPYFFAQGTVQQSIFPIEYALQTLCHSSFSSLFTLLLSREEASRLDSPLTFPLISVDNPP